ncbi:hypothetical protein CVM52_09905 [Pseudooceanicola lipolyticus]|uniref:MAPEG family protein n=1 Tax=Pseudooceanicola lipolyticus TaxID=2029104 RepID=A0A2M8J267_9RHOB|nr:MAPEG family protein [Pseudooceanicola lipolyticus]PJE36879.1 hypothetical protein CVM52_09905 [Pseudooceanicola lipolyticus]
MTEFAEYSHALVSMALFVLMTLVMSPLTALQKSAAGLQAGEAPRADYADPVYRLNRAYLNATEMMGSFVAATGAAILAGASPFWVNLAAALFFVSRVVLLFIHLRGIGRMNTGPRSFVYAFGWACCILLALLAIFTVF